jgi:hypothetical protein
MRHWKVNGSRLYHIPRAGQLRGSGLVDTAHAYNLLLMSLTVPEMVLAMAPAGCPDLTPSGPSLLVSHAEAW